MGGRKGQRRKREKNNDEEREGEEQRRGETYPSLDGTQCVLLLFQDGLRGRQLLFSLSQLLFLCFPRGKGERVRREARECNENSRTARQGEIE